MRSPLVALLLTILLTACKTKDPFTPSPLGIDDVGPRIEMGMTVRELESITKRPPVLFPPNELRWVLKDGSIWTVFTERDDGEWEIVGVKADWDHPQ